MTPAAFTLGLTDATADLEPGDLVVGAGPGADWLATELRQATGRTVRVGPSVVGSASAVGPNTVLGVGEDAGAAALADARPVLERWAAAWRPRTVLLAGPRSFCAGVDRAIAIVERAIERHGAPVYVRRQIVHNLHVIRDLERAGAVFVEELDEVPEGALAVFAAHGVAPPVRDDAERRGLRVIDATCPLVAKVHTEARSFARRDYDIVLIGHADHEEVEGTLGEAPDRIQIVDRAVEVGRLQVRDPQKVAYLTQTTLAVDDVADVVDALRTRFPAVTGPRADDICYATQNRQEAVRAIVDECDLVLVIGSRNSSNSNRLAEVASRSGTPAVLIEDASELDLRLLGGATTIGLTAGASAPEALVEGVVEALQGLGPVTVHARPVLTEDVHFALPAEVR